VVNRKAGLNNVLLKSLHEKNAGVRDYLLQIANLLQDTNLSNFCENQEDFEVLLGGLQSH